MDAYPVAGGVGGAARKGFWVKGTVMPGVLMGLRAKE